MSNQSDVQAAVRNVTGTALSYEGDWHALFDAQSVPAGTFNERMLSLLNTSLGASYTGLPAAQQAYAVSLGFTNWSSMNTVSLGGGPTTTPAVELSDDDGTTWLMDDDTTTYLTDD